MKNLSRSRLFATIGTAAIVGLWPASGWAAECDTVRFATIGWTDVDATSGVAINILEALGYQTETRLVSPAVSFLSIDNGQIDVFTGYWVPSMVDMAEPYLENGNVEVVRANLEGAKYTLAVPGYVYDAGVRTYSDLAEHKDRFGGAIYGIDSGSGGNKIVRQMIEDDHVGLADWSITESSEQGMLSQVDRAIQRDDWIVFLGWEPHPMNTKYDIRYLPGGESYFGENLGEAKIHTIAQKGYAERCPNVYGLLANLSFSLEAENEIMGLILDDGVQFQEAGRVWMVENAEVLEEWLDGVTTTDGGDGLAAVRQALQLD